MSLDEEFGARRENRAQQTHQKGGCTVRPVVQCTTKRSPPEHLGQDYLDFRHVFCPPHLGQQTPDTNRSCLEDSGACPVGLPQKRKDHCSTQFLADPRLPSPEGLTPFGHRPALIPRSTEAGRDQEEFPPNGPCRGEVKWNTGGTTQGMRNILCKESAIDNQVL